MKVRYPLLEDELKLRRAVIFKLYDELKREEKREIDKVIYSLMFSFALPIKAFANSSTEVVLMNKRYFYNIKIIKHELKHCQQWQKIPNFIQVYNEAGLRDINGLKNNKYEKEADKYADKKDKRKIKNIIKIIKGAY